MKADSSNNQCFTINANDAYKLIGTIQAHSLYICTVASIGSGLTASILKRS